MATSGTVQANGQELYFEIHGEGDPLVLVMGIGYDSSLWTLHQVPTLARRFRVVIFDNRDAGRSSRANCPYTIADMADDVAGLLDALEISSAHVMGLSMGALIAQEFALRHGSRLCRLVLSGPDLAPARQMFHPIAVWNWVKSNDTSGATFAAEQFTWLFSTAFLGNREAVQQTVAFLSSNPAPVGTEAYARQARAYLEYDPTARLAGIDAPTLVIVGEQDLLTPPWIAREVASAIPGARLEIIAGAGASHVVPLERPDEFNRLVTRFLMAPAGEASGGRHTPPQPAHLPRSPRAPDAGHPSSRPGHLRTGGGNTTLGGMKPGAASRRMR
jgi:3-oxoadipate enol-lactonase